MNLTAEKFAPQWKVLHKVFYEILGKSRKLAIDISAVGTTFTGTMNKVIRKKNLPPKSRAKVVTNTAKATDKFEERAAEIEHDLDNLDLELTKMQTILNPKQFAKDHESEKTRQMDDVISRISTIREQLRSYDDQLEALTKRLGITPIIIGILSHVIPSAGLFLVKAAMKAQFVRERMIKEGIRTSSIQDLKERSAVAELELDDALARRKQIKNMLGDIRQAREELKDICLRIGNIRGILTFFKGIWGAFRGDAHVIAAWLNDPLFDEEDMVKMPDVFLMMTKDATEYYGFLSEACRQYADGLTNYS